MIETPCRCAGGIFVRPFVYSEPGSHSVRAKIDPGVVRGCVRRRGGAERTGKPRKNPARYSQRGSYAQVAHGLLRGSAMFVDDFEAGVEHLWAVDSLREEGRPICS